MPEPGEVKEGLVWTGTAWVPLQPISPQAASESRSDGSPPDRATVLGHDAPKPKHVCPLCRKSDRLIRISGLLDSSTTQSVGYTAFGGAGIGNGGVGVGVGDAITETFSTTALAKRFEVPAPPIRAGCFVFPAALAVSLLLGSTIVWGLALVLGNSRLVESLGNFMVLLSVVVASLFYIPIWRFHGRRNKIQERVASDVSKGYYCQRDDCAFSETDNRHLSPEEYVDACFEPYLPELVSEINSIPLMRHLPSARRISSGDIRWKPNFDPLS